MAHLAGGRLGSGCAARVHVMSLMGGRVLCAQENCSPLTHNSAEGILGGRSFFVATDAFPVFVGC